MFSNATSSVGERIQKITTKKNSAKEIGTPDQMRFTLTTENLNISRTIYVGTVFPNFYIICLITLRNEK